jgi:phosphatidylglycerophosphatase A
MPRTDALIVLAATWFGVGRLPFLPGTWGSAAALPLWWLLAQAGLAGYGALVLGLAAAAVPICGRAQKLLGRPDPPEIVLDEVVGQLLALAGASGSIGQIIGGVLLFRLFDIVKPFPIGWIDSRVAGGLGIVLDDVLAGVGAGISLVVLCQWLPL